MNNENGAVAQFGYHPTLSDQRSISIFDGRDSSTSFFAVSTPATGSFFGSKSPICTSTGGQPERPRSSDALAWHQDQYVCQRLFPRRTDATHSPRRSEVATFRRSYRRRS